MKPSALFVPLLTAAYASAHGFLATVTIDGKPYKGDTPRGQKNPSIIRQVSDVSPVKGANNPDVNCGKDAARAELVANANAGATLTFDWRGGDNSFWPHNTGPMLTYMASCGNTPCDQFDSTKARWFKIQQVGRKSNGDWAQQDLMSGGVATVTLPSNIAPGSYMIRHEIISLHLGGQQGGAEFYPACAQIKIGGNGNGAPKDSELVSLPGAYKDTDRGILVPDIFNSRAPYDFPGPEIASFVNGGSSGAGNGGGNSGNDDDSDSGSGSSGTATYGSSRPSSTSPPSSSNNNKNGSSGSSKCKLKKSSSNNNNGSEYARDVDSSSTGSTLQIRHYPRHISRVMRNLAFGSTH